MWTPFAVSLLPQLPRGGDFEAAAAFAGARQGWVFQTGDKGLGYYPDMPLLAVRARDLGTIFRRVGVVTGHERKAFKFVIMWHAQLFQYPQNKSCMLCFLSKQGAGKGEYVRLLREMIGHAGVLTTTKPQKHVWGQFNIGMANAFLVVLNEVGAKGFADAEGEIKAMITDGTMMVEKKFCDQQEIDSYHRFILTAQVKDGESIPTTDDERRYFIARCSDELCTGHADDHAAFAALVKKPTAQRDFYDYLMSLPVKQQITKDDIPVTDFHRTLNESNRDDIEQ